MRIKPINAALVLLTSLAFGLLLASCDTTTPNSPRAGASGVDRGTAGRQPVVMASATAAPAAQPDLQGQFTSTIRPFLEARCVDCHSGDDPAGHLDLDKYKDVDSIVKDDAHWVNIRQKLLAGTMPPKKKEQPTPQERQTVIDWIKAVRLSEARKHAGDPGVVPARRLSNAELNYTVRDLTGVDLQPAKEFPVDPANLAGFDNSGESLDMTPALMNKYLQAARDIANHMVLKLDGIAFAPYPVLVETDRDKYCVNQIIDFYHQQVTDYAPYFLASWQYKNRAALGKPDAKLADFAAQLGASTKYAAMVYHFVEETKEEVGPGARLQAMWKALPAPTGSDAAAPMDKINVMRDFVVAMRKKTEGRYTTPAVRGAAGQPALMWRNRIYAYNRTTFQTSYLQVQGERSGAGAQPPATRPAADETPVDPTTAAIAGPGLSNAAIAQNNAMGGRRRPGSAAADPDLIVPAGQRQKYEEAWGRFCAIFPDTFYISERGRAFPDNSTDKGRLLSAGFHNVMGYFRDDKPLYDLILNEQGQRKLDRMWGEMDTIADVTARTYVQFYLNESGESRVAKAGAEGEIPTKDITAEASMKEVASHVMDRVKAGGDETATQAIGDHFKWVHDTIRWAEKARVESEPKQLNALLAFAERAYRRPLTTAERDDLLAFYHSLRKDEALSHEDAMRDTLVSILVYPDFCYRVDLVDGGAKGAGGDVQPLSDYSLASRLSYFLWASMPDAELMDQAKAGDLHKPDVLAAQTRRMLKDPRTRALAVEFGGNWLDIRRFEEINTVDRERYTTFNNDLRSAMFEEPMRFMLDVFQNNRSVLDFLYAKHTFVNPVLAKHYGIPDVPSADPAVWVCVDDATPYGRGGLLPMAAFLTKNAPGLRTSPVKRGYWLVKRVLGEEIPPPPNMVPELPRDEAKLDLPLRDMLARHRADPSCNACHSRFDSLGLVFEGFGPAGERRTADLAGHPVDTRVSFPDGSEGTGVEGVQKYIRDKRQNDFVDNLFRKMLCYALNRSLILSDELTVDEIHNKMAADNYRFETLVTGIVTSPQFLTKQAPQRTAQR